MKKLFYLLMFAGVLLASCAKDPVGETSTKALAGEWYVMVDAVDESGKVLYSDPFDLGRSLLLTYNTAANNSSELYVDDRANFWDYKVRVNSDAKALTFSTGGAADNESYDSDGVTIESGRIIPAGTVNPHGTRADSIVFYVTFGDDDYIGDLYAKLRVSGFRYTGFESDK